MLDFLLPRRSYSAEDRWGPGWAANSRRGTSAGIAVNEDSALSFDPVWCASRIVCETESSLPFITYERFTADESSNRAGDTRHAGNYYLYDLVKTAPNPDMTSEAFREGRTLHMANHGNGFAEIEWDSVQPSQRTRVNALWPIHPSRVVPVLPKGQYAREYQQGYRYVVRNNDSQTGTALYPDEMLHLPGVLCEDGIWGKSVIQYHRETISAGVAARQHGASQFGNGQVPPGIIFTNRLKDREARKGFRQEWREIHQMRGNTEVGILGESDKYQALGFSNEQAQYLETSKFNVSQIARIYRIPVYMLEEYEKAASFASVEQRSIDFVIGFLCWLRRWEAQCNLKLILPRDRATYFTEHNLAGLLRGDFASRMAGYVQALMNGIMTINEVRRLENLNNIGPAGDLHYVPMNMTTAQAMLAGPAPVAPPAAGGDGATLDADAWTREILLRQQEETRRQLGHTTRGPSALMPPLSGYAVEPEEEPAETSALGDDGLELLALPDVRQQKAFDCGAACVQTVAEYFGVGEGRTADDYIRELGTTASGGTKPEAIVNWFNDHGLITTSGPGLSIADLRKFFCAGQPVIVPVQMYGATPEYDGEEQRNETGHYVCVRAVGLGQVFYQDPIGGPDYLDAETFDQIWHDIEADGVLDDHFGIAVGKQPAAPVETERPTPRPPAVPGKTGPRSEDAPVSVTVVVPERTTEIHNRIEVPEQQLPPLNIQNEIVVPQQAAPVVNVAAPVVHFQVPAVNQKAVRVVLVDAFARALTKLANALRRELSSITDAGVWLDGFLSTHGGTLAAALEPAAALLGNTDGAGLLGRLAQRARMVLCDRMDTDTPTVFQEWLTEWPRTHAGLVADELLAEVR